MNVYLARQPIFDANQKLWAYELLYRESAHAQDAGTTEPPRQMTAELLVGAVLGLGLEGITGGRTAFLNLPETLLLEGITGLIPPEGVVLEVLEDVRPTPDVVEALARLKSLEYTLALDDFRFRDDYAPLLDLADIVKVDVLPMDEVELVDTVTMLKGYGVELLAEKVETPEMHERCVALGFDYFQGYHYVRPENLSGRDLSASTVAILNILRMLRDPGTTGSSLEGALRGDPALSYKLLRMVNSAAMGGRGIESIEHALRLVGRDSLYRWLTLILVTSFGRAGTARGEITHSALLRGRLLERLAQDAGPGWKGPAGPSMFLVGLLSHMDQLMALALDEILDRIALAPPLRAALLEREGPAGQALQALERFQAGEWNPAFALIKRAGLPLDELNRLYLEALDWASEQLRTAQPA